MRKPAIGKSVLTKDEKFMACATPFDALRLAVEYLGPTLYKKANPDSRLWMEIIPREDAPQGIGLEQSVFTIGRSLPTTDEPDFDPIALTSGEDYTGSCGTTWNTLQNGFNETTFAPEQFGMQSEVICQDDLIYTFQAQAFWARYLPALAKNAAQQITNRYQAVYTHYAPKAVANEDFHTVDGGTGAPPQHPDLTLDESLCELSQDMLDATAMELARDGATDPDSDGFITLGPDGPIYPLYISPEMSQKLLLDNAELREDMRFAAMGKEDTLNPLLMRLGTSRRVIKNFRHVPNLFPPRYTYAGGEYTRVATWEMVAGTKGTVAQLTTAYKNAPYEGAYVLTPWVFTSQIIKPVNHAAGNMTWSPKNYMGEWQFVTGGNRISPDHCYDPLEKLGRLYAEFKHWNKPIFPEFGRTLIYKRCQTYEFACNTCS